MSYEDRYILWNYMLAEHCLLADSCGGTVLLTVTPRTLTTALDEAGESVLAPIQAEADFIACVAAVYQERVLKSEEKLRALKWTAAGDVPFCIGFLALSVLAAFHMRTDEERTGRAFYPRLAEMLGCDLSRSYPMGFDGEAFIELWQEVSSWLKSNYNRELAAPDPATLRPYVAYPLSHVPLREVDIERLPQFFDARGYEPGARAPLEQLSYDLYDSSGPWRYLTEAGRNALEDQRRRPFVVRQVAHELDRWDGSHTDPSGARSATIELWMDIRRRRAQLYLLARRPNGFPEVIEEGDFAFASSQEGWYEPVGLGPEDGALLERGMRVGVRNGDGRYFLQLRQAKCLALTPSETYTGFVSDRVLRMDTECAVLCSESLVDDVARYLETLGGHPVRPRRDETMPNGWCLFTDVRPTQSCSPPPALERLGVDSSLALIPEGGLRLGRRWVWLESAPARLIVLGSNHGLSAKIDGQKVELDAGGRIQSTLLAVAGPHVVEVGNRLRQRVLVLQGTVNPACRPWRNQSDADSLPVPVPAGHWALLGTTPGAIDQHTAPAEGKLVRPSFSVRWAVQVAAGPGAQALHIHDTRPPLSNGIRPSEKGSKSARQRGRDNTSWIETIHQAGVRHPRFACLYGCAPDRMTTEWRSLMKAARAAKRQGRRR